MPAVKETILVVEDMPANLALLNEILGGEYRMLCATRGEKGLQVARAQKPDLILLDVVLPDMDGYEVCARLKGDPVTQDTPVIFITAMSEETDEAYGLAVGAIDYITKPFRPAIVQARVRTHLKTRQLYQRVLQAQKLESLGVLAGGIAHRFNNLLTAILTESGLAAMKLPPAAKALAHLGRLDASVEQAAGLARQMLAYSGKGRFALRPVDLSRVVIEMAPLLQAGLPERVTLECRPAPGLPPIQGDPDQIRDVLLCLVSNAAEATAAGGGTVTLSTGVLELPAPWRCDVCLDHDLPAGRYVTLRVADTGCGMDAETLRRAFDPFFSTRFMGRGLGLAAAQGIVRGHRGCFRVEGEPGKGSTFTLIFPSAGEETHASPDPGRPRA